MPLARFTASAIPGSGRGRDLGFPTINVNLASVPVNLEEGIFACTVEVEGTTDRYLGAMHYGPRPVFRDTRACEVHLIDTQLLSTPAVVTITVFKRLREIRDFPSTEELSDQIALDIAACREILASA